MPLKEYFNWYESYVLAHTNYCAPAIPKGLLYDVYGSIQDIFLADIASKYPNALKELPAGEASDNVIIELLAADTTIEAVLQYRIQREIFVHRPDNSGCLNYLANVMKIRTGTEIYYSTEIGKGLNVQHGVGMVIGPRFTIGENFMVHQGVTMGQRRSQADKITIGNNVILYAGAKVLGHLTIGDNVKLAANAVLLTNALPDSTYAGCPAVKVK